MKRAALLTLGIASPAMLVALLTGGPWAERVFVLGSLLFPVALCALGAGRRAWPFLAVLGLALPAAGLAVLWGAGAEGPAAAGIWWLVGGLALLPLLITGIGYAVEHRPSDRRSGSGGR